MSALGCLSCSGKVSYNPVKGSVLYQSRPVEGIVVTLHPKDANPLHALVPSGVTKADGTFELSSGSSPGAPAGEYLATFTWPKQEKSTKITMEQPTESPDQLKGQYADYKTSSFKVEIKKGKNQLEPFQLK